MKPSVSVRARLVYLPLARQPFGCLAKGGKEVPLLKIREAIASTTGVPRCSASSFILLYACSRGWWTDSSSRGLGEGISREWGKGRGGREGDWRWQRWKLTVNVCRELVVGLMRNGKGVLTRGEVDLRPEAPSTPPVSSFLLIPLLTLHRSRCSALSALPSSPPRLP